MLAAFEAQEPNSAVEVDDTAKRAGEKPSAEEPTEDKAAATEAKETVEKK